MAGHTVQSLEAKGITKMKQEVLCPRELLSSSGWNLGFSMEIPFWVGAISFKVED